MGVLISSQPLDALHSLSFAGVRVHSIYDVFLEWVRIGTRLLPELCLIMWRSSLFVLFSPKDD